MDTQTQEQLAVIDREAARVLEETQKKSKADKDRVLAAAQLRDRAEEIRKNAVAAQQEAEKQATDVEAKIIPQA